MTRLHAESPNVIVRRLTALLKYYRKRIYLQFLIDQKHVNFQLRISVQKKQSLKLFLPE